MNTQQDNYTVQGSCANCLKCFTMVAYDEGPQYFCTDQAPLRPRCGSVAMHEEFRTAGMTSTEAGEAMDKWSAWSESREVQSIGICDCWAPRE